MTRKKRRTWMIPFIAGLLVCATLLFAVEFTAQRTSTDKFCEACHVHPHSTQTWKTSPHFDNPYGLVVHCVDCHLPPKTSPRYYTAKAWTGARDVYGVLFKDTDKIDWEKKSQLERAVVHTYESTCVKCHQNLFPIGLSKEGEDAHLYYNRNKETLNCLNCHLRVGHYTREEQHAETYKVDMAEATEIFKEPAKVTTFETYTETVPGTPVSFEMIAIAGGSFTMGSPKSEPLRDNDEVQIEVELDPFWMGRTEVTWNEYEAFYAATSKEGRSDTRELLQEDVDGITGPTPPYEPPDQNWGRGTRPAITMTHHAATVYCEWISQMTGKTYRLPTEAEWEYAARAGTQTPYFFEGNPKKFSSRGFARFIFKPDTSVINSHVIYELNSTGKTQTPDLVQPNPFGLLNMLGNVREFCSDWYTADLSQIYTGPVNNPQGPESGKEYVVRGGAYNSDAADVRCAERGPTDSVAWLVTDPQMPKSKWWYSDVKDVGFRVVCEYKP